MKRRLLGFVALLIFTQVGLPSYSHATINENTSCAASAIQSFRSQGFNLGGVFQLLRGSKDFNWDIVPGWTHVAQDQVKDNTVCD